MLCVFLSKKLNVLLLYLPLDLCSDHFLMKSSENFLLGHCDSRSKMVKSITATSQFQTDWPEKCMHYSNVWSQVWYLVLSVFEIPM